MSRSQQPFPEILFQSIIEDNQNLFFGVKKLKVYEIMSLIPSMARARFRDQELLNLFTGELIHKLREDEDNLDDMYKYLSVIIERLFILNYQNDKFY